MKNFLGTLILVGYCYTLIQIMKYVFIYINILYQKKIEMEYI